MTITQGTLDIVGRVEEFNYEGSGGGAVAPFVYQFNMDERSKECWIIVLAADAQHSFPIGSQIFRGPWNLLDPGKFKRRRVLDTLMELVTGIAAT